MDVSRGGAEKMNAFGSHARRGSLWSAVSQLVLLICALFQTAILARMLLPADFGLAAIASVLIGWLMIYASFGLSAAVVQRPVVTDMALSGLYLLNLISGVACSVFVALAAPLVASAYGVPQLETLLHWFAPAFVLSAIGGQYRALLQRNFEFKQLAVADIAGAVFALTVSVGLAFSGYGVLALAAGYLASIGCSSLLCLYGGLRLHKPRFEFSFRDVRPMLSFGAFQMGESTLNYLNSQIDLALIGKFTDPHLLGLYSAGKSITVRPMSLTNAVFQRVALPLLSATQRERKTLRIAYLRGFRVLCSLNFPIFAFFIVGAEPVIRILLGVAWLDAVPIFQLLSGYFLVRSTGNATGALLLSGAYYRRSFVWNLIIFLITPTVIFMGSHWSIEGVSSAMLTLQIALVVPNWYFLVRPACGANLSEYIAVQTAPLLSALAAGAAAWPFRDLFFSAAWNVAVMLLIGGAVYILISLRFNRQAMADIRAMLWVKKGYA